VRLRPDNRREIDTLALVRKFSSLNTEEKLAAL